MLEPKRSFSIFTFFPTLIPKIYIKNHWSPISVNHSVQTTPLQIYKNIFKSIASNAGVGNGSDTAA